MHYRFHPVFSQASLTKAAVIIPRDFSSTTNITHHDGSMLICDWFTLYPLVPPSHLDSKPAIQDRFLTEKDR